jgi:hypothetical protein
MSTFNEQTKPAPTQMNIALKWGMIGGLASIIVSLGLYYAYDQRLEKISNLLNWGLILTIAIVTTLMAMKEMRTAQGGYIRFGRAYSTGLLTSVFIILIIAIYSYVFLYYIVDFDMLASNIIDESTRQMKEKGMSQAEIEKNLSYSTPYFTPKAFLIWGTIMNVIVYLIINLITAAIAKKEQPIT